MWQYHPLLLVFQLGVLISIGVAGFCAYRLRRHGYSLVVTSVGLLAVCTAIYNTTATLKVASPALPAKLWWYKLEFFGSATFPSVALVLVLAHLGHQRWLTRPVVGVLVGLPAVAIPLIIWNPGDVMITEPILVTTEGGLQALEHGYPPLFVILGAWARGVWLFAVLFAGYEGARGKAQRAPTLLISAALSLPLAASLLKSLQVYPPGGEGINVTPAFTTATLGLITLAVVRYRLFDLLPVGRVQALDLINDGYVLADPTGQVVDANPAAQMLLGEEDSLVGRLASDLLPTVGELGTGGPFTFEVEGRVLQAQPTAIRDGTKLAGWVLMMQDITERKMQEEQLKHRATHDPLTGLANREAIENRVRRALSGSGPAGGLLYLDLDRFKQVNDTYGHSAGDELLKQVAEALTNAFRDQDTVGRIGGDEFVVWVAPFIDGQKASTIARRVEKVFDQPFTIQDELLQVACSIGVVADISDYETADSAFQDADVAMYEAKQSGDRTFIVH